MENLNSCCFVATINEIKPIEGADNIELVIAGGWNAITKKGEFKEGSLTIIATTDAVIPRELSHWMGVENYLRKGGRVRTVKLRGVYSECLIIPIIYARAKSIVEGKDLMEELKITKYEPPVKQIQLASGHKVRYQDNPNFLTYYKFPNSKNVPGIFTKEDRVQITRKLHGTNARYGIVKKHKLSFKDRVLKFFGLADKWVDYEYVYGSHNVEKGSDSQGFYSTDVWRTAAEKYNIETELWNYVKFWTPESIGKGIVLYGEVYGAGIQSNYDYGLKDIKFALFDVMEDGKYLDTEETESMSLMLSLEHVRVLYNGPWNQEVQDEYVFNNFIEGSKIPHEGVVIKHISGERGRIAKVINPDYLIYAEKKDVGDSH